MNGLKYITCASVCVLQYTVQLVHLKYKWKFWCRIVSQIKDQVAVVIFWHWLWECYQQSFKVILVASNNNTIYPLKVVWNIPDPGISIKSRILKYN